MTKQKNTVNKKLHSKLMGQKKNRKQAAKDSNKQRLRELNQLVNKIKNGVLTDNFESNKQVLVVDDFQDFISAKYSGEVNAVCFKRDLNGDFEEIVTKIKTSENITEIHPEDLLGLDLSENGQIARDILLKDLELLQKEGASPVLNVIQYYERDDFFFPTDVYSYHVDRSPIPTNTILCTYFGAASDIVPNSQVTQKILIQEIRAELRKMFDGEDKDFEAFLSENFFDLHYQANPSAEPTNLGIGNLWKLAVDHPESEVLPCVHRAPKENKGEKRLLLIC